MNIGDGKTHSFSETGLIRSFSTAFVPDCVGLFFGRRGRETQRQLTPTILSLRKIHQGVEYFELNRSRLEPLPATKKPSR